jgi:peptide deformylase
MSKFALKTEPIISFGNKDLRQICKKVNVFHKSLHNKIDIMANTSLHDKRRKGIDRREF